MKYLSFLFSIVVFAVLLFSWSAAAIVEIKPDLVAKQGTTAPQVPDYLLSSTNASIDLMNHLNRMDGAKAQEAVKAINEKIPFIRAEAKKQNFSPFMIDVLDNYLRNLPHTIAEGEYYEATVTTNQITSILASMISWYNPRVPFILGHIDYLLQDVYINANFREFDYAAVRYNDIWLDWKGGLIDDIKSHGGTELATKLEKGLGSLEISLKGKDIPAIEKKVKELKEIVSAMEGLY